MRIFAIALAIPLAAGLACRTSSTQGSSGRTASAPADDGTGQAQAGAQAGTAAPNDVRAHADDHVVMGKLTQVASDSVTITTDQGDQTTLQVVPQTTVMVDGQEAQAGDLQEGQPVRASFNDTNGQSVAVEIRAGQGALGGERTIEDPGTYVTDPNTPNVPGSGGHSEGGGGGPSQGTPVQPLNPEAAPKRP